MRCVSTNPLQAVTCCCDTLTNVACPAQILVIDRINGPAAVLIDTISLLLNREISVTYVDSHDDVFRVLEYYQFDLVVVGLHADQPIQLTILPWLHDDQPSRPVLVVGRDVPRQYRQYARAYGACDVLNLPERAADLKLVMRHIDERYLDGAESESLAQAS